MTKEELEKEIKNYIDKNCKQWETDGLSVDDIVRITVLDFTEPREKRIAELENENADLKSGCGMCYRKDKEQLTKAKEIIKKLSKSLFLAKGIVRDLIDDTVDFKESKERAKYCYEQESFDTYREAEQFISEVEKCGQ